MSNDSKLGCLGTIMAALGLKSVISPPDSQPLPYSLRDAFLSPAEISLFHVLKGQLCADHQLMTKVRLADIFFVQRPNENRTAFNRIGMKHVDFLLCDAKTMQPLLGIELDDASHKAQKRQERDNFVDQVFEAAALPLIHIPAAHGYSTEDLMREVRAALSPGASSPPPLPTATGKTP